MSSKFLTAENMVLTDLGPCLHEQGVTYRVWALGHESVVAHIESPEGTKRTVELDPSKESGYFFGIDPDGKVGDLYKFSIDGGDPVPDFVSHYQPEGVFGPSKIVDAESYIWQAKDWTRPKWSGQVVYECHIGTFTPEGTFRSTIEKLDYLRDLGITALEIMPVADFAGMRNWGYDGVMLFAPARAYGTPDDFRALIDACHLRGLAVILDVVFNHLGPEGNFSHQYSSFYFHEGRGNPWGTNFNLDGENSEPVRALLRQNIRYWLDEFRIDGFRMDATNAVHDPSPIHLLAQAADIAHSRGAFIIAEDDRNAREILNPHEEKGWNFDAAWADDFHHVVRVNQTGEQNSYYSMVHGSIDELARTLRQGWLYTGEQCAFHQGPRGGPCDDFPPQSFVYCISNHDQIGNRLLGDRFHQAIDPAAYRALSLFLCLVPYTPMLFMGQEWGASTPFHYFTDMPEKTGVLITAGRAREYLENGYGNKSEISAKASDPQNIETFQRSKLNWSEIDLDQHRQLLDLYRAGLKLRRELFGSTNPPRDCWQVQSQADGVSIKYQLKDRSVSVTLNLKPVAEHSSASHTILLRSNSPEFSGAQMDHGVETIVTTS